MLISGETARFRKRLYVGLAVKGHNRDKGLGRVRIPGICLARGCIYTISIL